MTTYAAGLRVGEVVRLRLTDIESDRMLIRVNQGKGRKDRYTLLSARLLTELRTYWHLYRPAPWLFTGQDRTQPLSIATAQKIYYHAKRVAGITHGKGIHTLRNASTYCYTSLISIDFTCLAIRGCTEPSPASHPTQCLDSLRAMMCVRSLATRLVAP
jgi:integrase